MMEKLNIPQPESGMAQFLKKPWRSPTGSGIR
jgi:hypothetical protein